MIRRAVGAIVFQGNKFLIVKKTKINTLEGKQTIKGEWDFIKGGVEKNDKDLYDALIRELQEETGSKEYKVVKELDEKIRFDFSDKIKVNIGYDKQETTMFLVEFLGDINSLSPNDNEISNIKFIEKDKLVGILTHQDTKDYFLKYLTV
ncbi:NUDIX domain-containing protein [Bacillus sp. FJAT-27245]|uniref:NUDIX domain-containing protein n=1 Tax=Bacillus sp. FJAT-27245 TaxID=1684144 RepID=UPI0006A7DCF5|nr:NUDIX hydrolase [Bacillus sp. FJAT-27245]